MSLFKNTASRVLTIVLIFIALTILRLLWLSYFLPSSNQPVAHEGIFDIRHQQLTEDEVLHLNGEWLYYPNLVDPLTINDRAITYSSSLNRQTIPIKEAGKTAQSYGTYRLKIQLNTNAAKDNHYAIRIPAVSTASALYINGKLVGQSGKVASSPQSHRGQAAPYTVYFTNEESEIDLVLHVSNFDTSESPTISKRVLFSSATAMMHHQQVTQLSLATISIMLIIFALFSILVFLFIYRKPIVLLFTIGFLLPLADELITFDRSILDWLHLNYAWSFKLSSVIYLGASFFFVQFMRVLLVKYRYAKCFQLFFHLYALGALLIVLLPIKWLYISNLLFFILYAASFLFVVAFALREYIENQTQSSVFIALTALSTTNGVIWGLIKAIYVFDIPVYPLDYLFIMLGFSSYWFKRFFENTEQIKDLVAKLQKDDELKDEFLSSSSQKLWDPMNKMITLGQSIYDNPNNKLVVEDQDNLKYLIDIGRSMSFTLNDILDYTRLKEGKLHLHKKVISIQAAVYGVFDMLRFITNGKQIHMNSTISQSFPNILADEKRLIQILFNLLHNAIKYTDAGSIEISAHIEENMAVIHIHDTGLGIDDSMKSRLFSPYEQGNENDDGIGLGLLISKKLIELHGGTLKIHSIPNKGSDVYFTFPLAMDNVKDKHSYLKHEIIAVPVEEKMLASTTEKQFKILMVDDDPVNLTIMRSLFASTEYAVKTVTSSEMALAALKDNDWDLVIIDAMMPYISGYALIEMMREHYSLLELPILLLTARKYPEDVYTGFAHGANDYVTKPINALELKVRSRALIDLKYSIHQQLHLETAWLQAQIQPHFLFNTLNTIASLSTIDTDRMINLLHHFGEYLHASFDVRNLLRVIPLKEELGLVTSYLYIEQQRFGQLLHVEWDIDRHINIEIPPISIQTLVENAIRHGVLKQEKGGTVCIRIKDDPDFVAISVIDNGVGIDPTILNELQSGNDNKKTNYGVGIRNTDLRLKRIYGQRLHIESTRNKGTTVSFRIPKS